MRASSAAFEQLPPETMITRGIDVAQLKRWDALPPQLEWTHGVDDLGALRASAIRLTSTGDEYAFHIHDDAPEECVVVIGDGRPGLARRLDLLYATLGLDRKRDLYGDAADTRGERKLHRRAATRMGDARRRVRSRCESIWSSFVGRSASA